MIGDNDFRVCPINRNDEIINAITKKCREFESQNVLANKALNSVNIDDIKHQNDEEKRQKNSKAPSQ